MFNLPPSVVAAASTCFVACVILCGLIARRAYVRRTTAVPGASRTDRARRPTGTLFREKSIVAQILAILLVYGYYGVRLHVQPLTPYDLLLYSIMGAFAVAELVRLSSELFYYRLGA